MKTDLAGLESRLASTKALEDYVGTESPRAPALIGHLLADADHVRLATAAGPLITDDRCFIEYSAPRSMGHDTRPEVLEWLEGLRRSSTATTLYTGMNEDVAAELARRRESRRLLAEAVRIHRDDPERALLTIERAPVPQLHDPRTAIFVDFVANDLMFKAESRLRMLDVKGGLELLRRIPRTASCYVGAQLLLGETFVQLRRTEEARLCFLRARETDPKSFEAAAGLARVLQIAQSYSESAAAWRDVIALRPDSSGAHVQLALCLWRLEKLDEAKAACRKALEIDPKNARATELLRDLNRP